MAGLTDRDRKIAANALDRIERATTPDGDAEAALHALRRLFAKTGASFADLIAPAARGSAALRAELEEVTRERNALRRRVAAMERANAERMTGANAAREEHARRYAREVWNNHVADFRRQRPGATSTEIAEELTRRGVETPGGSRTWSREQVHRLARHLGYRL